MGNTLEIEASGRRIQEPKAANSRQDCPHTCNAPKDGTPYRISAVDDARVAAARSKASTARLGSQCQTSNLPMTVKEAAMFLGVSAQTVYLWVERKQIPHFRVMGRNIRFLKSDLRPFRAQFKQEVENGKTA